MVFINTIYKGDEGIGSYRDYYRPKQDVVTHYDNYLN